MVESSEYPKIRQWIFEACQANGVPSLAQEIRIELNNRLTDTFGMAKYRDTKLTIATKIWALANEQQKKQMIMHEACHHVVFLKYRGARAHGKEWRWAMERAGLRANRCHDVDIRPLRKQQKRKRFIFNCPCQQYIIGINLATKMFNGQKRICTKCKKELTYFGKVDYSGTIQPT